MDGRAVPGLVFLVGVDTCGIRTPPSPCKGEVLPLHYMAHRCPSYEGRIVSCFGYLLNPSCDLGRTRTGTGFLPSTPQADAYCQISPQGHIFVWSREDSNLRPADYESDDLKPTDLRDHAYWLREPDSNRRRTAYETVLEPSPVHPAISSYLGRTRADNLPNSAGRSTRPL